MRCSVSLSSERKDLTPSVSSTHGVHDLLHFELRNVLEDEIPDLGPDSSGGDSRNSGSGSGIAGDSRLGAQTLLDGGQPKLRWKKGELLGAGSFGEVAMARHVSMHWGCGPTP